MRADELDDYGQRMFQANIHSLAASEVSVKTELNPAGAAGILRVSGTFNYDPFLLGALSNLVGRSGSTPISLTSDVKLSGKVEVAMVIDNSFSMIFTGGGTSIDRIETVRRASQKTVTALALQEDTKVALVPFASTVNIGSQNRSAPWIDSSGIAPTHHENFDWAGSFPGDPATCDKCVEKIGNIWFARGKDWDTQQDKPLTRFQLFDAVSVPWGGCVEARPAPYTVGMQPAQASQDASGTIMGDPHSLFVPMFAVDEIGSGAETNDWWNKNATSGTDRERQANVERYFSGTPSTIPNGKGPNFDCTVQSVIPLTDVSDAANLKMMQDAIKKMTPVGDTNVGDAIAWGLRILTPGEPFDETESGRLAVRRYMIILTDGANTYNVSSNTAGTVSRYGAHGYVKPFDTAQQNRIFMGTGVTPGTSEKSFSDALDSNMKKACDEAKSDGIILITLALDLDSNDVEEHQQISLLQECASPDAFNRSTPSNGTAPLSNDRPDPEKLFWNISSDQLEEVLAQITSDFKSMYISR
ncbi:vWA domain-containing protein [Limoniibacter endophyticus]|nr:vWA domain-containing protein [Limoniibacter endophyticus]